MITVEPVTIRLGFQIPNFSYGTGVAELFPTVIAQAREAEAAGFDSVFLMDHFYQLPMLGTPDQPMLEAYTALGALATATEKVQLGTLVTGNTYRNPTLLTKAITTLDVVSGGRAILGIGTGWFELEHEQLGFEFGTFTDRFNKLEEALQIILPMLRGERPTVHGKHYHVTEAINSPAPVSRIPVMIGGSGEKKTLRMVAQYADEANLTCLTPEVPRKLEALAEHCEKLGRDRSEITVTKLVMMVIGETHEAAEASAAAFIEHHGWPAEMIELVRPRMVLGDPDEVGEQIAEMKAAGIDGITLNLATSAHQHETIELAARTALAALS